MPNCFSIFVDVPASSNGALARITSALIEVCILSTSSRIEFEFGFAHCGVELRLELVGMAAHDRRVAPKRAHEDGQLFRADKNQRHDPKDQKLAPADFKHRVTLSRSAAHDAGAR